MAARKIRKFHTDEIREKIKTSQLINRLTDHALGDLELSSTQVRSIEVLLRKAIPDLSSITLDGNLQHDHIHKVERGIVDPVHVDPSH